MTHLKRRHTMNFMVLHGLVNQRKEVSGRLHCKEMVLPTQLGILLQNLTQFEEHLITLIKSSKDIIPLSWLRKIFFNILWPPKMLKILWTLVCGKGEKLK